MKTFPFIKYSATGNDFFIADNRQNNFSSFSTSTWKRLCHRQEGIGADGLLLLESAKNSENHFRMRYFNADGQECSMCGNGARAITFFAHSIFQESRGTYQFETMNGIYRAQCLESGPILAKISLQMSELHSVGAIEIDDLFKSDRKPLFLNTGVPHCVFNVSTAKKLGELPIMQIAPNLAHQSRFQEGSNINFYTELAPDHLSMRTFERGVEGETLSCGTGAVAVAYSYCQGQWPVSGKREVVIDVVGGQLSVTLSAQKEIGLIGPVKKVFYGSAWIDL